jgi:hypothetical protein
MLVPLAALAFRLRLPAAVLAAMETERFKGQLLSRYGIA